MNMTTFSDREILRTGTIIFLHQGALEDGRNFFVYLAVTGDRLAEYYTLLKSPDLTLERFGEVAGILRSGTELTDSIKTEMERNYGVVH